VATPILFSTNKRQEFLISLYFLDTHTHECGGRSPRRRTRATASLCHFLVGVAHVSDKGLVCRQ